MKHIVILILSLLLINCNGRDNYQEQLQYKKEFEEKRYNIGRIIPVDYTESNNSSKSSGVLFAVLGMYSETSRGNTTLKEDIRFQFESKEDEYQFLQIDILKIKFIFHDSIEKAYITFDMYESFNPRSTYYASPLDGSTKYVKFVNFHCTKEDYDLSYDLNVIE